MPEDKSTEVRPLRADALRNRQALLAAAREAFTAGDFELRIEAIARRAGVGIGTFYRHFETREALITAVFQQEVEQLCATADGLLERLPGNEALQSFLQKLLDYLIANQSLATALSLGSESKTSDQGKQSLREALRKLMLAASSQQTIRADATPEAILLAFNGICASIHEPDWEAHSRSLLTLLLAGLRQP